MSYQNLSVNLSAADLQAVKQALATISQKLPFLISLTPEERQSLTKMGPKSIDFVHDCQTVVNNYPTIFPPSISKAELSKDIALYGQLSELIFLVETLGEKLSDTAMAVGSEAMNTSLDVYEYVKTASKTQPGIKTVADSLQQRFKGQGRTESTLKKG